MADRFAAVAIDRTNVRIQGVTATNLLDSGLSSSIFAMIVGDQPATLPWTADVLAARRGDHSAFASLVRSVQRPVYGLCLRLLATEAEAAEAAQETFLKAFQNLHVYDEHRPFDVWVLAIARNCCRDVLRRRSHSRAEDLDDVKEMLPSADTSQEEQAIESQQQHALEAAVSTLAASDREVLVLYYVQKRTTREIAEILEVAPGTIMARLFRAREKLRKKVAPEELQ